MTLAPYALKLHPNLATPVSQRGGRKASGDHPFCPRRCDGKLHFDAGLYGAKLAPPASMQRFLIILAVAGGCYWWWAHREQPTPVKAESPRVAVQTAAVNQIA